MKEYVPGNRVCIHPEGTIFRVIAIHGKYCEIIDDATGEEYPLTLMSMLDPVNDHEAV